MCIKLFKKNTVNLNLTEMLLKIYDQQNFLAEVDKSFVRTLPVPGTYTRKSAKEAIYYAECAFIEVYEYIHATQEEALDESADIAIFTMNVLAYLGCQPHENLILKVPAIKNAKKVIIEMHKILAEVLYKYVDYKQWKFPDSAEAQLSLIAEEKLFELAKWGFALAAYEISKRPSIFSKDQALKDAIYTKMSVTRKRALNERTTHTLQEMASHLVSQ